MRQRHSPAPRSPAAAPAPPPAARLAVVYARVSTEDQARRGYSLPEQVAAGRSRALALGFAAESILVLTDDGVPGDVLSRPGLDQARELARQGRLGVLVCMDPDRLSRDLLHQLLIDRELERAGVRLEFINFTYDRDPMGQAFFGFRGILSQLEKALIRERTTRGKLGKAKRGGLTHAPGTYGYVFDPATDQLLPDESFADPARPSLGSKAGLVRLLYVRADQGERPNALATWLNDLRLPGPRGGIWHRATVLRILRNETYTGRLHLRRYDAAGQRLNPFLPAGERVHRQVRPRDEWLTVPVPALVDRRLWTAVQQHLDAGRRPAGPGKTAFLLSGLVTCGRCGAPVRGTTSRGGNGRRYRWYVCAGRSPGNSGRERCPLPFLRAEDLEEAVWAQMRRWLLKAVTLPDPPGIDEPIGAGAGAGAVGDAGAAPLPPAGPGTAATQQEVASLRAGRKQVLRLLSRGLVSEAEAASQLAESQAALDRLEAWLAAAAADCRTAPAGPPAQPGDPGPATTRAAAADALDRLDLPLRQRLVRLLIESVVVSDPPRLILRARVP